MIIDEKIKNDIQNKIEEVEVESKTKKFSNFILSYYIQFCIQKGIKKITVDSYTKFINYEISIYKYLNS